MKKLILYSFFASCFALTACSGGGGGGNSGGGTPAPTQPADSSYELTWSESNSGSVSGLPADLSNIAAGTVITLELTLPSGFKLDHWTGVCDGSTTQCQFTVSSNVSAGVVLAPIANYLLSLTQPSVGGTISQTLSGTSFTENSSLTFYANADTADGFKFKKWTGDCSSQTANSCILTFTKDMTVSAEFECLDGKTLNGSVCEDSGTGTPQIPVVAAKSLQRTGNTGFTHVEKILNLSSQIYVLGKEEATLYNSLDGKKENHNLYLVNSSDLAVKIESTHKFKDAFILAGKIYLVDTAMSIAPSGYAVYTLEDGAIVPLKDSLNASIYFDQYTIFNNELYVVSNSKFNKLVGNTLVEIKKDSGVSFSTVANIGSSASALFISELNADSSISIYKKDSTTASLYCSSDSSITPDSYPNLFLDINGHSDKIIVGSNSLMNAGYTSYEQIGVSYLCDSLTHTTVQVSPNQNIEHALISNNSLYLNPHDGSMSLMNLTTHVVAPLTYNSYPVGYVKDMYSLNGFIYFAFVYYNNGLSEARIGLHQVGSSSNSIALVNPVQKLDNSNMVKVANQFYYVEKNGTQRTLVRDDLAGTKVNIQTITYTANYGPYNNSYAKLNGNTYFFFETSQAFVTVYKVTGTSETALATMVSLNGTISSENGIILLPNNFYMSSQIGMLTDSGISYFNNQQNNFTPSLYPQFISYSSTSPYFNHYARQAQVINGSLYTIATNRAYNLTLYKAVAPSQTVYYNKEVFVKAKDDNFDNVFTVDSINGTGLVQADNGLFLEVGSNLVLLTDYYGTPITIDGNVDSLNTAKSGNFVYYYNKSNSTMSVFNATTGQAQGVYTNVSGMFQIDSYVYYVGQYSWDEMTPDMGEDNPPQLIATHYFTTVMQMSGQGYQNQPSCNGQTNYDEFCWPQNTPAVVYNVNPGHVAYVKAIVSGASHFLTRYSSGGGSPLINISQSAYFVGDVVGHNGKEFYMSFDAQSSQQLCLHTVKNGTDISNCNFAYDLSQNGFYRIDMSGAGVSNGQNIDFSQGFKTSIAQNVSAKDNCPLAAGADEACVIVSLQNVNDLNVISFKAKEGTLMPLYDKLNPNGANNALGDNSSATNLFDLKDQEMNDRSSFLTFGKFLDENYNTTSNLLKATTASLEVSKLDSNIPNNSTGTIFSSGAVFFYALKDQPMVKVTGSFASPVAVSTSDGKAVINPNYVGSIGAWSFVKINDSENASERTLLINGSVRYLSVLDNNEATLCASGLISKDLSTGQKGFINTKLIGSSTCATYSVDPNTGVMGQTIINGENVKEMIDVKGAGSKVMVKLDSGFYFVDLQSQALVKVTSFDFSYEIKEVSYYNQHVMIKTIKDGRQKMWSVQVGI